MDEITSEKFGAAEDEEVHAQKENTINFLLVDSFHPPFSFFKV